MRSRRRLLLLSSLLLGMGIAGLVAPPDAEAAMISEKHCVIDCSWYPDLCQPCDRQRVCQIATPPCESGYDWEIVCLPWE